MEGWEVVQHEIDKASAAEQARLDEQNSLIQDQNEMIRRNIENSSANSRSSGEPIFSSSEKIKIAVIVGIALFGLSLVLPVFVVARAILGALLT